MLRVPYSMFMLIDLQLHSTYSDGYLTPTQLVKFISDQGVKVASLTDHNTVGGLDEFRRACGKHKIKPIVGLELYVKFDFRRLNLLWYNFDDKNPELHNTLRNSQTRRRNRTRQILKKLKKLGFKIEADKILDKYNHYVPINRIIDEIYLMPANRKIINRKLRSSDPRESEIIKEYFKNEKIGILRESYINMERILFLRKKAGGQLILNHPAKHSYIKREFWEKLGKIGINGVEVLSPHHSIGAIMQAQYLARELNFITTGGSDFHRFEGDKYPLQSAFDYFKIDAKYLRGVNKIIG